jgi:hypothetical protein
MMFTPIHNELVAVAQRQDRLREAEKERLIRSIKASSHSRPFFSSVSKWIEAQVTRLRCSLFPFSAAPVCTP